MLSFLTTGKSLASELPVSLVILVCSALAVEGRGLSRCHLPQPGCPRPLLCSVPQGLCWREHSFPVADAGSERKVPCPLQGGQAAPGMTALCSGFRPTGLSRICLCVLCVLSLCHQSLTITLQMRSSSPESPLELAGHVGHISYWKGSRASAYSQSWVSGQGWTEAGPWTA